MVEIPTKFSIEVETLKTYLVTLTTTTTQNGLEKATIPGQPCSTENLPGFQKAICEIPTQYQSNLIPEPSLDIMNFISLKLDRIFNQKEFLERGANKKYQMPHQTQSAQLHFF